MKKIKHPKADFTSSLLPQTRREQFKDLFKNEWKTLLALGFILFLFALPYLVLYAFRFFYAAFYSSALIEGGLDERTIQFNMIIFHALFDLGTIIPYSVLSLGLAGTMRVMSNLVYGEGVLFKDDFINGIKKAWKAYLFAAIIFGLVKAVYSFGSNYLTFEGSTLSAILNGVLVIVVYLFVVPTMMLMLELNSTYNITFINNIQASFKFTVLTLIPTGLFSIGLFFVLYLSNISQLFIIILIISILIIVIVPIYLLLWKLFIAHIFDKFINVHDYLEFYRKGLAKQEGENHGDNHI
ncbi:MAG: hypothetical protein ACOX3K_02245 [Bacilli bacterium]|jgi:hypothetical protein